MRTPARSDLMFHQDDARRPHTGLRRGLVAALTLLALLTLARPAGASSPEVFGVQDGDRLNGPAIIWAEARGPSHWMSLRLTGPGTNLEARGINRRVHLRESASSAAPLPWDAGQARPGNYTLVATSHFRGRSWGRETIRFTVPRRVATRTSDTTQVVVDTPAEPAAQSVPPPTPAPADEQATEPLVAQTPTPQPPAPLPVARFVDAPASFAEPAGGRVRFELTGPLPEGGDVLALAWDRDRGQIVDRFAHVLTKPPYVLDVNRIARLPLGNIELQLHVRDEGRFVQTDTHDYLMTAPPADRGGPGATLPQVSFPSQSRNFTRGDGRPLRLNVEGDLPQDADLLVIAWSLGRAELVERFAYQLTAAPWQVPAEHLDRLPAGQNEVQVLVRRNGQVQRKVALTVRVSEPAAPSPPADDDNPPSLDPPPTGQAPEPLPAPVDQVENPAEPGESLEPEIVDPAPVVPVPGADLSLEFAPDVEDTYVRGSDDQLRVQLGGRLPDSADVLLLAWHHGERQMIGSFAHTLRGGDRTIKNGQLDKLPAGRVELQAHLRLSTGTVQVARQDITIEVPEVAEPEPTPVADPLPPIAAGPGFTEFPLRPGGRAIYVSSSQGNDSNTGLSPNSPLKTPSAGIRLLRDGQPDQLLLKAGDTFRGGLGSWTKSGRDADHKMVVGVYGDGPRPKFYSDGQNLITCTNSVDHVAFVGLHAYANRRDPNGPDYRGDHGSTDEIGVAWYGRSEDLHFEDLKFEWFTGAMVLQNQPGGIRDVRLHRLIVVNSWKHKRDGHSAGMYFQGAENVEITDSLYDHNGWRPGRANERTQFNHNLYFQKDTKRINVRRTILTRGSHNAAQFRGGGILEDCLLAYNPYGVLVAQEGGIMRRNVVLHGNDMLNSYPLGLGLEVLPSSYAVVEDNVIAHKRGTAGWIGAIQVAYRNDIIDPPADFRVIIRRNRVANYPREYRRPSIYETTDRASVTKSGNLLDYASGGDSDPPYIDPSRDLDAYARHLGLADMDAFLKRAAARERGQWEERYSAVGANAWIRAGYEFLPYD